MSKHRAEVKPRWGRICLSTAAGLVVLVALLGAVGLFHGSGHGGTAYDPAARVAGAAAEPSATASTPSGAPAESGSGMASYDAGDGASAAPASPSTSAGETPTKGASGTPAQARTIDTDTALPADSGEGRRAVFSMSRQRVWIVDDGDDVERTYLVSGSVTDNLQPGTYAVYSRSENAWGVDDSGTMKWFVRFAHGPNAAIGFHDIPVKDGQPLQTLRQLGTPQSHGCIRQKEADALAMWDFAQIGTKVVVTA
ncbi:L,D-transpeptidase family protein [Nocardioides sp. DS6]|uniref:L,D-transpeptidase family protein n=1 Tax=Nocardioides eburneus TaxID=3231482 RepID=A0ABV3T2C2_9ACTN